MKNVIRLLNVLSIIIQTAKVIQSPATAESIPMTGIKIKFKTCSISQGRRRLGFLFTEPRIKKIATIIIKMLLINWMMLPLKDKIREKPFVNSEEINYEIWIPLIAAPVLLVAPLLRLCMVNDCSPRLMSPPTSSYKIYWVNKVLNIWFNFEDILTVKHQGWCILLADQNKNNNFAMHTPLLTLVCLSAIQPGIVWWSAQGQQLFCSLL